jgi:hypothetical protein
MKSNWGRFNPKVQRTLTEPTAIALPPILSIKTGRTVFTEIKLIANK